MVAKLLTNGGSRATALEAEEVLDSSTTALLMWDLQEGLGGHASNIAEIKPRMQALLQSARANGIQVIWSQHIAPLPQHMSDPEVWRLMRKQGVSSPDQLKPYMQRGSSDTRFLNGFVPGPDDLVIEKTTPSIFVGTGADARLRVAGIRTIVMAGVATDVGIEFTARHALALGYFPVVVSDAVGSFSDQANKRGLVCLETYAFVEESQKIMKVWSNAN